MSSAAFRPEEAFLGPVAARRKQQPLPGCDPVLGPSGPRAFRVFTKVTQASRRKVSSRYVFHELYMSVHISRAELAKMYL